MNNYNDIKQELLKIISRDALIPMEELETKLNEPVANLGIDSMLFIGVVTRVEEYFKISISNEMFSNASTIGSLIKDVEKLIKKNLGNNSKG